MEPELTQFESKSMIPLVNINVDRKSDPNYIKYSKLMTSRSIPFTIIVNPKGEVATKKVGYMDQKELVEMTRKTVKK